MKRDSVSAYVHMRRDTPSPFTLYAASRILDEHSKQLIYLWKNKWNGIVGWKKRLGEQH